MSENNGKPEAPAENTAPAGTDAQTQQPQQPANPTVEASPEVQSYLKGLGLENAPVTAELVKLAEAGMKQKASVSRLSLEKEQLLAKMTSQGVQEPEYKAPESQPEQPQQPTEAPQTQTPPQMTSRGVTDNDLFDLSRMIATEFQEIAPLAEDGSLFKDLRQLGYFTNEGIDKKAVYDYLNARNAQAKELRELREFKQKYGQPDPNNNPAYNAQPGVQLGYTGEMTYDIAHSIVLSGNTTNPRYAEAVDTLRKRAMKP